jgi:hypothetical protein
MSWLDAAPAALAAVVVILLPGAMVVASLRMGLVARAAVAGVAGVALTGLAGVLFAGVGLTYAAWQPFVLALVAGASVWAFDRRRTRVDAAPERSRWRWILLTWILTAVVVGVVAYAAVPSPDRVSQTYDNVFHMSAIAAILDGQDASSLTLRTLIETDRTVGFYPAAWHSLAVSVVQLSGATPTVAVNSTWFAVAVVIWVPGAAWLAQVLLRRYESGLVALVAMPLAAGFGAMPYALLSWGSLYPTFLATALLPAAAAIPVLAGRALAETRGLRRWRVAALGAVAILGTMAALTFSQPRVLASWVLLLAPPTVASGVRLARRALQAGGQARRRAVWSLAAGGAVLVLSAAAGFAYLIAVLGLFGRPLDERLGGPQAAASQSVLDGMRQALGQGWPTGVEGYAVWPAIFLALAVAGGVVAALRYRGVRWIVVSYTAVIILFALAAGSDDVVTKLATALWYKDRYRLASLAPVLGVTLAALGIFAIAGWIIARRRLSRGAVALPVTLAWVVALSAALALVATGTSASIGEVFRLPASHATSDVVSQAQIEFIAHLPQVVPDDQRVLGDPWDGSAWTQLFGDREPVFPHVNGQWDEARIALAYRLDEIGTEPAVCAALDDLRVRYVMYNPHEFGGGDPAGNHFAAVHRAVEAGLFTEVANDGDSTLYRIDQCGPIS